MEKLWRWLSGWSGAPYRYYANVFRRIGVSLRAGVDMVRTLETESSHGGPSHQRALQSVCRGVKAGQPLWQSMESVCGYFPVLAVRMIRAGEETGRLDTVLLRLADHYDHLFSVRRDFLSAITWPMVELGIALGVIGLLIVITGMLDTVDLLGFGLVGTRGLVIYLLILAAVGITLVLLIYAFQHGFFGTGPLRVAMKLPMVGKAIETSALSRFTWTLSATLDTGMDVRYAIRTALESTVNPVYQDVVERCERHVAEGNEIHTALQSARVFPRELVDMVEAAEIAGTLTESLNHIAKQYEEQARFAAQVSARILAFLVWLLVAVLIIALIFRLARIYFGAIHEALEV